MNDFIHDDWRTVLAANGIDNFDSLWNLPAPWYEEPNRRRGGWSGVARIEATTVTGEKVGLFLKRQENHKTFSWRHPFLGIPTFLREFELIRRYQAGGIPTLEPVYFAMRNSKAGHRAILMTRELQGFVPLAVWVSGWKLNGMPSLAQRRSVISATATLSRSLHAHRMQHNCYYPKHIFIRPDSSGITEARVIDLEKSRWRPLAVFCALRDLDTLNRHAPEWSRNDRLRFLKTYLGIKTLNHYARWLWQRLAHKSMHK